MTDNREATVLQFAMFMQARDARPNGQFTGVSWEMLDAHGGQAEYLKDAEAYLSAIELLGYAPATPTTTALYPEEIEALPDRTVIRDKQGDVWERRGKLWCSYEMSPCDSVLVSRKWAPVTVLHRGVSA
jgi:hypothetical protein